MKVPIILNVVIFTVLVPNIKAQEDVDEELLGQFGSGKPRMDVNDVRLTRSLMEDPRNGGILRSLRSVDVYQNGIMRSVRSNHADGILRALRSVGPYKDLLSQGMLRTLKKRSDPRLDGILRSLRSVPSIKGTDFVRSQGILRSTRSDPSFDNVGSLRTVRSDIFKDPNIYDTLALRYL